MTLRLQKAQPAWTGKWCCLPYWRSSLCPTEFVTPALWLFQLTRTKWTVPDRKSRSISLIVSASIVATVNQQTPFRYGSIESEDALVGSALWASRMSQDSYGATVRQAAPYVGLTVSLVGCGLRHRTRRLASGVPAVDPPWPRRPAGPVVLLCRIRAAIVCCVCSGFLAAHCDGARGGHGGATAPR